MPSVSIIIPCLNEQETIRKLLEAIHAQTFPRADLEVVIADGMSTDGPRAEINATGPPFERRANRADRSGNHDNGRHREWIFLIS